MRPPADPRLTPGLVESRLLKRSVVCRETDVVFLNEVIFGCEILDTPQN